MEKIFSSEAYSDKLESTHIHGGSRLVIYWIEHCSVQRIGWKGISMNGMEMKISLILVQTDVP
jgi:hypothetical protein